jgi:hypothetical protein
VEGFHAESFQTYTNPAADPDNTRRSSFVFSESHKGLSRSSASPQRQSPLRDTAPRDFSKTLQPRVGFGLSEALEPPVRLSATTPSPKPSAPNLDGGRPKKIWDDMEVSDSGRRLAPYPPTAGGQKKVWDDIELGDEPAEGIDPRTQSRVPAAKPIPLLKSSLRTKSARIPALGRTDGTVGRFSLGLQDEGSAFLDEGGRKSVQLQQSGSWPPKGEAQSQEIDESQWNSVNSSRAGDASVAVPNVTMRRSAKGVWQGLLRGRGSGEPDITDDSGTPGPFVRVGKVQKQTHAGNGTVTGITAQSSDTTLKRQNQLKSALKSTMTLLSSTLRSRK